MSRLIYQYFDDDELLSISGKIKESEKLTAGEIAVSIKEGKGLLNHFKPIEELAKREFIKLGIKKTRDKTGVLIFILLKEKQFYILADSAINDKVHEDTWHNIKNMMQEMFKRGYFAKGVMKGIEETGKVLAQHFPIKPDDTNELSDRVNF
jgi:uncharacterized membrane protein